MVEQVSRACRTEGTPENTKPTMPKRAMVSLRVSGFETKTSGSNWREKERKGFSGFVDESKRENSYSNNAKSEEREWSA